MLAYSIPGASIGICQDIIEQVIETWIKTILQLSDKFFFYTLLTK
jgi:hypothetical protein